MGSPRGPRLPGFVGVVAEAARQITTTTLCGARGCPPWEDEYAPSAVGLFTRKCRRCGEAPQLRIAPRVEARIGTNEVEFTNLPYRACACGRVVKWAFDPGLEFGKQLFYEGVHTAGGSRRHPRCSQCRTSLLNIQEVTLPASAKLDGFQPIGMTVRMLGYRCPECGTEQAPPGAFDVTMKSGSRSSDAGRALDAAFESIGLPV